MDELFTKYEHELVTLRSLCRTYAQRFPKVAAQLQMDGDTCDDPHVERLIQGVALLNARVAKRLDDAYPQFTEALLEQLYPHYLRPFPSCAIARVLSGSGDAASATVARGTLLVSAPVAGVPCTFQTVYDVTPSGVVLTGAHFEALIRAPVATRLPAEATSSLSLQLAAAQPGRTLDAATKMRVYIDSDTSFCAALRDTLFMRTEAAYLQVDEHGPWERLPAMPVKAVGFADDDALIPFGARSHPAYRILAEYFAFPDKFNFFDIDLRTLQPHLPAGCTQCTLHLAIGGTRPDSDSARMLARLSTQHLLQGCTPVVNLFRQPGVPITVDQLSADYTLLADGKFPQAYEVHSVDQVHMVSQRGGQTVVTEFRPFYALGHAQETGPGGGNYWLMRHDDALAVCSPGHEKSITLVNAGCDPFAIERHVLSIELTCTNRDLPCALRIGAPEGDLFFPGATGKHLIRLLRRPTRPARLVNGPGMQWRLISHLTLNHHSLTLEGADGLREMLTLYDLAPSPVSRRQISGIVALESGETTAWIKHKRGASLVHGTEVRITLEEDAYAGAGLYPFVQVLDQFFALYVQMNSFVELVIVSRQSGKELCRCKPRSGNQHLV